LQGEAASASSRKAGYGAIAEQGENAITEKAGGDASEAAEDLRGLRSRLSNLDRAGIGEVKAEIARLKADVEALLSRERTTRNNGPAVQRNR
jgi:hypothetical protein